MTTYAELRTSIRLLLGDELDDPQYQDNILHDAIVAAHVGILPWVGKSSKASLSLDGVSSSFALPEDTYQIVSIYDGSTGEFLPSASLSPGQYFGVNLQGPNAWVAYPEGYVTFARVPGSSDSYSVYYQAYWSVPAANETESSLEVPSYAQQGLLLYGSAYALLQTANLSSNVRQWGTRVDSGTPEHNPVQRQVDFLMKLFAQEMNKHPKTEGGQR